MTSTRSDGGATVLLIDTVSPIEAFAVIVAVIGMVYGLKIRRDAVLDVEARHVGRLNSGREELARLLVITSSLLTFSMACFLLVGLSASISGPNPHARPSSYFIQAALVLAESSVAATLWYKQRVRRRVLLRDMESDEVRLMAAALLAAEQLAANTDAIQANTDATVAATDALQATQETRPDE